MKVPFATTEISAEAQAAAARVLASGWVTTGPEVHAFEEEFAAFVGTREAVAVSSCTAAIELALRALELPPGAPVLTSTITFSGAVHAIVHAGLRPVLTDADPVTGLVRPSDVAAAVAQHGQPAAMVVTHLAGAAVDVTAVAAAAGLPLSRIVEDAAHAIGTTAAIGPVGAAPTAATCFSFYATKNLPIGEGGMVTTARQTIADRIRRARLHGMSADAWRRYLPGGSWRYSVDAPGLKANMTDLQAAIGREQLKHFPAWQQRRHEIAGMYADLMSDIPGVRPAFAAPDVRHAWHLYVVHVDEELAGIDRDGLIEHLTAAQVGTSVHFIPVHQMPYFQRLTRAKESDFSNAERYFSSALSLPLHPALTDAEVFQVARTVRRFVRVPLAGSARSDAADSRLMTA